jgi:hypothetical protein
MTGISRRPWEAASCLCVALAACGGRSGHKGVEPSPARVIPLASAIVLETAGPPPADTTVTFTAGEPRVVVLRHGPPENVVFAEVTFAAKAFHADSGRPVEVEIRPRPGVYGLDLLTSVPFSEGASVVFKYPRYFSAPAKARAVYGSDVLYSARRSASAGHRTVGGAAPVDQTVPATTCRPHSHLPGPTWSRPQSP